MNNLHIVATSRAVRESKSNFLEHDSLIGHTTTIADFLSRSIVIENRVFVDSMLRVLYLKEAADFSEFKFLKSDLSLVKFYSNSKEFFSFFEELSVELVDIDNLLVADTYAEFDRDLNILKELKSNYREILDSKGLIDSSFVSDNYSINWDYINSFDSFELELEGLLTNFELELFSKIAEKKEFTIKLRTLSFNMKLQDSFRELSISLPNNSDVEFSLSSKKILYFNRRDLELNCEVIKTRERLEQISIAFAKIEEFIDSGIDPNKIALITPDESLAEVIRDFDKLNNYNLAMGYRYSNFNSYMALFMIKEFMRGKIDAKEYLKDLTLNLDLIDANVEVEVDKFFEILKSLNLPLYSEKDYEDKLDKLNLAKKLFKFKHIFKDRFTFKEWIFLWLSELSEHTIDDVRGGKVTIMGVLESRGVNLDAVVVLDFNEDIVPTTPKKDRFLNSEVRSKASLPTKKDRENLQKYYYARLLERVKRGVVVYHTSSNHQPSKFLYELGINERVEEYKVPNELLFLGSSNYRDRAHEIDIEIKFDAKQFEWSATSLKIFLECKRRFYYKYISKIAEPYSDDINEGAILHEVLSRVLTVNCNFKSSNELKKALDIEIANIDIDNKEILYKKVLWSDMLKSFADEQFTHLYSGWSVIDVEQKVSGKIEGLNFKGYIDRVDKRDGRFLVIDYKSGNINNSQKIDKITDFQMSIYKLLYDKPVIDFAYLKILESQKLEFVQMQEEKEERLIEIVNELKSQTNLVANRCENLQTCRYCPYQLLCHRGEYL